MQDIIADFLGEWCKGFNVWGIVFKIAIVVIMSAIVGCERATKRHAAGLRTFMLVSLISMLAAAVDGYISIVAALCAVRLCPRVRDVLFLSHASYEIGYRLAAHPAGAGSPASAAW